MSQQSRILLIASIFAIAGVSALAVMASRYGKIVEQRSAKTPPTRVPAPAGQPHWREPANPELLAKVDGFIRVRSRLRAEIDRLGSGTQGKSAFTSARDRALTASGVEPQVYAEIRGMFRDWRMGRLDRNDAVAAAFEQRRAQLEPLDLGRYEALDS